MLTHEAANRPVLLHPLSDATTDASHIQNVSAEALGVRSIPPKTGDDWDHIEEILEHWNRTSNAGLPAMPDPWPPEF